MQKKKRTVWFVIKKKYIFSKKKFNLICYTLNFLKSLIKVNAVIEIIQMNSKNFYRQYL